MKRIFMFLFIAMLSISLAACDKDGESSSNAETEVALDAAEENPEEEKISVEAPEDVEKTKELMVSQPLEVGDSFTISGMVDYSDEPSDIGKEYCFVAGDVEIEYYYTDIYDERSQWKSDIFYTKGADTGILKKYVGQEVTLSGIFDSECHGIPYITNISIHD